MKKSRYAEDQIAIAVQRDQSGLCLGRHHALDHASLRSAYWAPPGGDIDQYRPGLRLSRIEDRALEFGDVSGSCR